MRRALRQEPQARFLRSRTSRTAAGPDAESATAPRPLRRASVGRPTARAVGPETQHHSMRRHVSTPAAGKKKGRLEFGDGLGDRFGLESGRRWGRLENDGEVKGSLHHPCRDDCDSGWREEARRADARQPLRDPLTTRRSWRDPARTAAERCACSCPPRTVFSAPRSLVWRRVLLAVERS